MIRFPNPLAGVSQIVAKAFAILGEHDGVGRRSTFGIRLPHDQVRRPMSNQADESTPARATGDQRPGDDRRSA